MDPTTVDDGGTGVFELYNAGRFPRAMRLVDALLAEHGPTPWLLAARAQLLSATGRLAEATQVADLAVDRWPGSAVAHTARADVLQTLDRNAEALAEADRALALNPPDPAAHAGRAVVLADLGDAAGAVQAARRAQAVRPGTTETEWAMAYALQAGDPREAAAYTDQLVARRGDPAAYWIRGFLRFSVDDYPAALADATRAIELDPDCSVAHLIAAMAAAGLRRWDDTIARCGVAALQGDLNATTVRAAAYGALGRAQEAAAAARLVLDQQPRNMPMLGIVRDAQLGAGAWTDLVLTCTRMLVIEPDHGVTLTVRARALCELGRAAAALDDLNRVLAREPRQEAALAVRSVAQVLLDRYPQALADADASLARGPDANSVATDARILALLGLGRRREAEELAGWVLRVRPGDELARNVIEMRAARQEQTRENLLAWAKVALRVFVPGS